MSRRRFLTASEAEQLIDCSVAVAWLNPPADGCRPRNPVQVGICDLRLEAVRGPCLQNRLLLCWRGEEATGLWGFEARPVRSDSVFAAGREDCQWPSGKPGLPGAEHSGRTAAFRSGSGGLRRMDRRDSIHSVHGRCIYDFGTVGTAPSHARAKIKAAAASKDWLLFQRTEVPPVGFPECRPGPARQADGAPR